MSVRRIAVSAALALVIPVAATATPIVGMSYTGTDGGVVLGFSPSTGTIDPGPPEVTGHVGETNINWAVGFVIGGASVVAQSATFYLDDFIGSVPTATFTMRLLDQMGASANVLYTSPATTFPDSDDPPAHAPVTVAIPDIVLSANTAYYLMLTTQAPYSGPDQNNNYDFHGWAGGNTAIEPLATLAKRWIGVSNLCAIGDFSCTVPITGFSETSESANLAFQLDGRLLTAPDPAAVPEPATLSLLGLGLAGAAVRRRLSRSKTTQ